MASPKDPAPPAPSSLPQEPTESDIYGTLAIFPPEIRLLIWTFATARIGLGNELTWPDPRSTHGAGVRDRRHALALLRVNKQIHSEAVRIVYGGKTFRITLEVPGASQQIYDGWEFKQYLNKDEEAGPEHMPGPAGTSATSWWHLLASIDVSIVAPSHWTMSSPAFWCARLWEVLALRRKVVRLVDSLKTAQEQGLGLRNLDIYVAEQNEPHKLWLWHLPTLGGSPFASEICVSLAGREWLRSIEPARATRYELGMPADRYFPDRPWKDLDFLLADFKRLRNVKEASVEMPPGYEKLRFYFDVPEPLVATMKRAPGSEHPQSRDAELVSLMENFSVATVKWWTNYVKPKREQERSSVRVGMPMPSGPREPRQSDSAAGKA